MKKTVKTASKTIQAGSSGELSALMPAMRVLARITSAGTISKRSLEAAPKRQSLKSLLTLNAF